MAINLMCMNDKCKYYYEDNCMRNISEERLSFDETGKCTTFKEGKYEAYEFNDTNSNQHSKQKEKATWECNLVYTSEETGKITYGTAKIINSEFRVFIDEEQLKELRKPIRENILGLIAGVIP